MHQLDIKVLNIIDARCNHEVYDDSVRSCSKFVTEETVHRQTASLTEQETRLNMKSGRCRLVHKQFYWDDWFRKVYD